jgi:hypothetical protein
MGIRRILPIENYTLKTSLSTEKVHSRINSILNTSYSGTFNGNTFKMSRQLTFSRNSFLPVIEGTVLETAGKTEVHIRMRLNWVVLVFMAFWMGCVSIACLVLLFAGIVNLLRGNVHGFNPMLLIPFGMLVFGWMLSFFAFHFERNKSKSDINDLLEAENS